MFIILVRIDNTLGVLFGSKVEEDKTDSAILENSLNPTANSLSCNSSCERFVIRIAISYIIIIIIIVT
jgi:hypothetical protein